MKAWINHNPYKAAFYWARTLAHLRPNPSQLSSANAASMQPLGKGANVPLPWGGLSDWPSDAGCSACPVGKAALALENWIGLGPQFNIVLADEWHLSRTSDEVFSSSTGGARVWIWDLLHAKQEVLPLSYGPFPSILSDTLTYSWWLNKKHILILQTHTTPV